MMLEWFQARENLVASELASLTLGDGNHDEVVEAMVGDAVMKVMLIMHWRPPAEDDDDAPLSTTTSTGGGDLTSYDGGSVKSTWSTRSRSAGRLNDFIVRKTSNDFLYHRHLDLWNSNNLPDDLLPPRGHASADPRCFEAWIGRVFKQNRGEEEEEEEEEDDILYIYHITSHHIYDISHHTLLCTVLLLYSTSIINIRSLVTIA